MLKILFSFILVSLTICCFSQADELYREDSLALKKVKLIIIKPDNIAAKPAAANVPFQQIILHDVRFDTSLVGLYAIAIGGVFPAIINYKINLQNGLKSSVDNSLGFSFNQYYAGKDELVVFVKKFFFSQKDSFEMRLPQSKNLVEGKLQADIFLKAGGQYTPLFKVDTSFISTIQISRRKLDDDIKDYFIELALECLRQKIAGINPAMIATKKSYSDSVVHAYYFTNRFNLPVLVAPNYKVGVYANLREFKQNNPSIKNYKWQSEKGKTMSLKDEHGNEINLNHTFGFCDGKYLWVTTGVASFPLVRVGNSFEFFVHFTKYLKLLVALDLDRENFIER